MKILILFASTGGGHIEAAKAIESYVLSKRKDADVRIVDGLKCISPVIDKIISGSYIEMAKHFKLLYKYFYRVTDKPGIISKIVRDFSMTFSKALLPLINEYKPDVIITTHPFLAGMISTLKRRGKIDSLGVTILTDYEAHNTWVHKNVDVYCVACEQMIDQMEERGVPREIVHSFGIPVNQRFFHDKSDRDIELRKELNLDLNKKTILVMAGSFGVNNICEIYKEMIEMPEDFQVVILTGNNQHLFNKMQALTEENKKETRLIKFTHDVYRYMKMADVLITKPGGLTVSEALASNLPLIVFDSIPGQEEANARFLIENGMAVSIGKGKNCTEVISEIINNDNHLNSLKMNCESFDKQDSVKNILEAIEMSMAENIEKSEIV